MAIKAQPASRSGACFLEHEELKKKGKSFINNKHKPSGIEELDMKSLVVYYSRTGNTKFVAEEIAAELGADIEEIVDLKSREGRLGWLSASRDGTGNRQTSISETKRNPVDYDLIVVGTPVWAWSPSAAVRTYFAKHDLSGKNLALFFTLDNNIRGAVEKTKKLIANPVIVGELVLVKPSSNKDETKKKIYEWCATLKSSN
jgi:flavodoxin